MHRLSNNHIRVPWHLHGPQKYLNENHGNIMVHAKLVVMFQKQFNHFILIEHPPNPSIQSMKSTCADMHTDCTYLTVFVCVRVIFVCIYCSFNENLNNAIRCMPYQL